MKKFLVVLLLIPITTFSQVKDLVDGYDLYMYSEWISGTFTTTLQSIEDEYFDNVYVYTTKFRSNEMGNWFYTEQGEIKDRIPYRKRIYIVSTINDTTIISRVFKLKNENFTSSKNESRFFNRNDLEYKLSILEFDDLEEMCGCSTYIYKRYIKSGGWYYYGSTNEMECKGTFRGATHTTSHFKVHSNGIVSWERGWNDNGEQVWGSTKGPYFYIKNQ
jgi:CpeT protein